MRAVWPLVGIIVIAFVGAIPFFFLWGALLYAIGFTYYEVPAPFHWLASLVMPGSKEGAFLIGAWLFSFTAMLVLTSLGYRLLWKRADPKAKKP